MIEIGIAGISGRIGQRLVELINKDENAVVCCGLVSKNSQFKSTTIALSSVCKKADIWIDFSTPAAFDKVLHHCQQHATPLVSGTTGLSETQFKALTKAAEYAPILWASNFSLSINLIQQMLLKYTKLCKTQAKITETHHIHKKDKPSGTAISLAKSINQNGEIKKINNTNFQLNDIAIKSIREGEVAGIHQIDLDNPAEQICIHHRAKTPEIFAQGAIDVSKWLIKQNKGLYTMQNYIESINA